MREGFRPFVRRVGEHLDGYGQPCRCTTSRAIAKPQPKARQKTEPKKLTRVPTWADLEQAEAAGRGIPVFVQSRDWGKS
jgi:hypothetical protein